MRGPRAMASLGTRPARGEGELAARREVDSIVAAVDAEGSAELSGTPREREIGGEAEGWLEGPDKDRLALALAAR